MKNKLFLRLCLTMVVVLSFNSCRQDLLHEKENYNNSGAFQLKSNRISLNESKHKAKLLPELEKAEAKFKEKSSAFRKIVNYGDGVSIDTDDVTYIQNGPNYHTYTFNIKRENAPADAPVENLVLSPLTNGTYRELLITYNFTPQEKQTLMNGGFVDTKGKTTVTELASGTYSGALAKTSCSYETVTINIPCTSSDQHMPGQDCDMTGNDAPRSFTMVALVCGADTSLGDDGSPGGGVSIGPTGGLGDGEDDGSGNTDSPSTEPGDCNGGLTAPQTPNYDISDGGCGSSIPTQPTLPTRNNPCQKIKATVNKQPIKDSLTSMKSFAQTSIRTERGFQELKSGTLLSGTVTKKLQVEFGIGPNSLGTIHVHPLKGIAMFSAGDIVTFLHLLREQDASTLGNAYGGMVSASGTYFINFTGTASDIPPAMTEIQEEVYIENLVENYITDKNNLLKLESKIPGQQLSNIGLEKLFFNLLSNMGLDGKISLIKEENGNTSTIQKDSNGNPVPNPC